LLARWFALASELTPWTLGDSDPTCRHGAAAPCRHQWPLLPAGQCHPQLLEDRRGNL